MLRSIVVFMAIGLIVKGFKPKQNCKVSDIKTIMGGNYSVESLSVDSLEARNATSNEDVSVLISFGAYRNFDEISSAFAFIYDYMNCKTSAVMEFSGINQGIQECDYN